MIREKGHHVAAGSEDVFGESLQGFLRADFYKDSRTCLVEGAQAFYELHGRGDLLGENIEHLRHSVFPGWIKLSVSVRDDGQARCGQVQPLQDTAQRFTGGGHNGSMESMADGKGRHLVSRGLKSLHSLRDC